MALEISAPLIGLSLAVITGVISLILERRRTEHLRFEIREARKTSVMQVQRHYQRFTALLGVSRLIGQEQSPQAIFDSITHACLEAFRCEQVSLMLVDASRTELEVRAAAGHHNLNRVIGARLKIGKGIAGSVAESGEALILGPHAIRPGAYPGFKRQESPLYAAMVVPIIVRGELVGVLNVSTHEQGVSYDEEDLHALAVFAENVGTCIRQLEQAEWMRQTIRQLEKAQITVPTPANEVHSQVER